MRCPACERENREGAAFCDACGSPLAQACSACGADVRPGARFCDTCGAQLGAAAPADLKTQTPVHLAQKILRERSQMEGERRTVTVLFVDAKGYTPLSEQLDAEKVYGFMHGATERMLASVHRYEGTVTQFTGDGIMATFGAPIAHEDSARRAVAAALDMQRSLTAYIEEAGLKTAFRCGLNTGVVVVGSIGDDLTMDYTAIGDTTNLAARMEQMCEPGAVFLTENTYRDVADYFECEDLGALDVKGKAEPVRAYKAVAELPVRSRMDAAVARGLSPFVGRDRDIDVLQGLWREAKAGRGQIVMISGEPGIGKSRLLLELHRSLGPDVIWREAHCVSYGENIPYLPVIELVRHGFGITESDDADTIIDKVDRDIVDWSPAAQKTVPYLKFLLQVDPGDAAVEQMDPMERRAGILDALRALIIERSRVAPRVVVVEDLHWADDQSEEVFRVCADVIASASVLMIMTFRPGYLHPSSELPNANRIALGNLDAESRTKLASAALEASALSSDLAEPVTTKAEGNPLFIEEVAKALASGATDAASVPNSLQDVILARIDRLERGARESLQLASVIGREFTLRLLDRISDLQSELVGVLTELKTLELIYEKTFFPELAYMFKHALTHDVAYSTLLVERRKALHRVVAAAIEELYADRLLEHYETLAHHYMQAEEWEKALNYLLKARDKSAAAFAIVEAITFCDRAVDVLEKLGRSNTAECVAVLEARGQFKMTTGDLDGAANDFDATAAIGRAIGDHRVLAWALVNKGGWAETYAHQYEDAVATLGEALQGCTDDDRDIRFAALACLRGVHIIFGGLDEARALEPEVQRLRGHSSPRYEEWNRLFESAIHNWEGRYGAAVEETSRLGESADVSNTLNIRWMGALALAGGGTYMEAIEAMKQGEALATRVGEPFSITRARNSLGWMYGEIQHVEEATHWNLACLEFAANVEFPDPEIEANAHLNLADLAIAKGDLDEAERHLKWVERPVRSPAPEERWALWSYTQHFCHSYGELFLLRGDLEQARTLAEECLDRAESTNRLKNVVKAKRLLAQTATSSGDLDAAGVHLEAALAIAHQIGNPPQLWKTLTAAGDLRRAHGRDATEPYDEATAVIERVAAGLTDELRDRLLASDALRSVRARAE